MTDEQTREDADRNDKARELAWAWLTNENAARRAHELAMARLAAEHCKAMAQINADSQSGGHTLGVLGLALEALDVSPYDIGTAIRTVLNPPKEKTDTDWFTKIAAEAIPVLMEWLKPDKDDGDPDSTPLASDHDPNCECESCEPDAQ